MVQPNVAVIGISVLILSLQSNLKVPEKVELFKSLSDQFLLLSHQIDKYEENEITRDIVSNLTDEYDGLVQQVNFSEVPKKYKLEVITLWDKEQKSLPLNLNGVSGIRIKKRFSNNNLEALTTLHKLLKAVYTIIFLQVHMFVADDGELALRARQRA